MLKKTVDNKYELMIILFGPEPQRNIARGAFTMKSKLILIKYYSSEVLLKKSKKKNNSKNITYYNYMNSKQLEQAFNESLGALPFGSP
jgi:hypothetical protein